MAAELNPIDKAKFVAAKRATEYVQDGMKLGLGTGSTAAWFVKALAARNLTGLRCVPTSEATAELARELGLTLSTLEDTPRIDLTVDGADEVGPGLALIKSMDGAGNAFPSLHVASAVFSLCWMHRILAQLRSPAVLRWISAVQCVAIVWSTMATLQHVALDVFAGVVVGLAFAAASLAHVKNTA